MSDSEKSKIIDSVDKSDLEKARNRMIAEGYRYRSLENRHSDSDSEDGNNLYINQKLLGNFFEIKLRV